MKNNSTISVAKHLSITNELAFSIGNTLDLGENCEAFLTLLLARMNYTFVSIWLKNDILNEGYPAEGMSCVYAYPTVMSGTSALPEDHITFTALREERAVSYGEDDPEFPSIIVEKCIHGGAYAIYPLCNFGILKIYAQDRDGAFSEEELARLRNVIRKFAVSVRGCLSHRALVEEIGIRAIVERRLEESKNALQTFIDSIPEISALIGTDGSVIVANSAFYQIHAVLRDGTSDPNVGEHLPGIMKHLMKEITRVLETGIPAVIEFEQNGRATEMHMTPVLNSRGELKSVAVFTVDITEKKKEMLTQLRESEQKFRELADFIPIILYECDETGRVSFANQTALAKLDLTAEIVDSGLYIQDCVIPEEFGRVKEQIENVSMGDPIHGMRFNIRRRDGTAFPALVFSSSIQRGGKNGGLRGAVIDISDQVMAEEALRRTNLKLSLLSSVTRHDILNQVTAMLLYKELLTDTIITGNPVDPECLSHLFEIAETIERQILFSRDYQDIGMKAPRWQHVGHLVTQVSKNVELSELAVSCSTGDLEIYADLLFEKVIFNLMENVLRHGLSASLVEVTWVPDTHDGGTLMISDNGVGVPDGKKEMIFEKGFGSNTGYGLHLIREILELTGITIKETGTVGRGATFSLDVPPGACRNGSSVE